jgi:hypothetical protein
MELLKLGVNRSRLRHLSLRGYAPVRVGAWGERNLRAQERGRIEACGAEGVWELTLWGRQLELRMKVVRASGACPTGAAPGMEPRRGPGRVPCPVRGVQVEPVQHRSRPSTVWCGQALKTSAYI